MSTMSVLAVLLGLVVVVSASAEKSFFDLFSGEWDVQRAQVHLETNEVSYEAYKGHYSIGKDNHTESVLSGRFFDINTDDGEVFNEFNLRLEFDNNVSPPSPSLSFLYVSLVFRPTSQLLLSELLSCLSVESWSLPDWH